MFAACGPSDSGPGISVSYELLEAPNSVLQQSEEHDSGWGIALYENGLPSLARFPVAAHTDTEFAIAVQVHARMTMVHVRRATIGGLKLDNTHPFAHEHYAYCHNGTIRESRRMLELAQLTPDGDTDSERFFCMLLASLDDNDVVGSLRAAVALTVERCRFSALNFLFCDGRAMYGYRLGVYEFFWQRRTDGATLLSSEMLDDSGWQPFEQDELVVCQPGCEPEILRLLGDRADGLEFQPPDRNDLSGQARGAWAQQQAAREV
jgi:predicted glutamine amidotransferase